MMTILFEGIEYENKIEFMEDNTVELNITEEFDEQTCEQIIESTYNGVFTLHRKLQNIETLYNFVSPYPDEKFIVILIATILPDIDAYYYLYNVKPVEGEWYWTWEQNVSPFQPVSGDKLIDLKGNIRKIESDDFYITQETENGEYNFQILPSDDEIVFEKNELDDEILDLMENDEYNGILTITYIQNCGLVYDDEYYIHVVDEDNLYLKPITPTNLNTIPQRIEVADEKDNKIDEFIVRLIIDVGYIQCDKTDLLEDYKDMNYEIKSLDSSDFESEYGYIAPDDYHVEVYDDDEPIFYLKVLDKKTSYTYDIDIYRGTSVAYKLVFYSDDVDFVDMPKNKKKVVVFNQDIYYRNKIISYAVGLMKQYFTSIDGIMIFLDTCADDSYAPNVNLPVISDTQLIDYHLNEDLFREFLGNDFYGNDICNQLKTTLPPK